MIEGWCVKCRTRREMKDIEVKKFRAYMAQGTCVECGTKMSRTLKSEDARKLLEKQTP